MIFFARKAFFAHDFTQKKLSGVLRGITLGRLGAELIFFMMFKKSVCTKRALEFKRSTRLKTKGALTIFHKKKKKKPGGFNLALLFPEFRGGVIDFKFPKSAFYWGRGFFRWA